MHPSHATHRNSWRHRLDLTSMNSDQADILDLLSGHTDDSTIERLAFECLMNGIADERVTSLLNGLAWRVAFD